MTKVKILSSNWSDILERMINEFTTTHEVINIKFSTASTKGMTVFSAMIIYEED
jgi:hypothetical protein